jgi:hypothetical protein
MLDVNLLLTLVLLYLTRCYVLFSLSFLAVFLLSPSFTPITPISRSVISHTLNLKADRNTNLCDI